MTNITGGNPTVGGLGGNPSPAIAESPISGVGQNLVSSHQLRINDLSTIIAGNISDTMNFAVDLPTETYKITGLQFKDYVIAGLPVGVESVFGRINDVIAVAGDYDAVQVDFNNGLTPNWSSTDVQDALNKAYSDIQFLAGAVVLKGAWDALAGVPDLPTIPKVNGNYWIVSVEGSSVLPLFPTAPPHSLPWEVSDQALYLDDGEGNTGFVQLRTAVGDFLPITGGTMLGDIIGSNALSYNAMTSLANTATQPLDNVSSLTNDAGYITIGDVPAVPVDSVNGQTGVVVLDAADVGAALVGGDALVAFNVGVPVGIEDATRKDYVDAAIAGRATSAQGVLADSATQPADPVSSLTNDAGYITAAPVTSVNAKTGVVVLNNVDVGAALVGGDAAQVFSVGTPTADEHATTKAYVDGAAGGIVKAFGAVVGADGNFQVSFGTAFPSVAYTISLSIGNQTIPHSFSLSWSGKLATGFLIESDLPQFSSVDWIAIENNN